MLVASSALAAQLSDLAERVQRLEKEYAELQGRIRAAQAAEAARRMVTTETSMVAQIAPVIGAPMEGFAAAIPRPLRRGTVGGIARTRQAARPCERWSDGRCMSHDDCQQIEREVGEAEYMRYAAGGFARASTASRFPDGTFAPKDL